MANLLLDLSKLGGTIEMDAETALAWLSKEGTKISTGTPKALAALTVVLTAFEKALNDVAADAANPTQITVNLPSNVADIKAAWADVKTFLADFGIKL